MPSTPWPGTPRPLACSNSLKPAGFPGQVQENAANAVLQAGGVPGQGVFRSKCERHPVRPCGEIECEVCARLSSAPPPLEAGQSARPPAGGMLWLLLQRGLSAGRNPCRQACVALPVRGSCTLMREGRGQTADAACHGAGGFWPRCGPACRLWCEWCSAQGAWP